jgi:hypothetical protein
VSPGVGVFLDYQNVHLTARDRFLPAGARAELALVHPVRLAELLVSRRRGQGDLAFVGVYRGRPRPDLQPTMTAANDAQADAWARDPRVRMVRRDLKYRGWPRFPPQEKGIDVALAVDLVRSAMLPLCDVAIVFSADTDLLPALEVTFRDTDVHLEIASWDRVWPLWFPEMVREQRRLPYCHFLDREDFEVVRDRGKYV